MKKIIAVILGLMILTGVVWYFATRGPASPKAAELLPETTLLYVAVPDFPKSRDEFRKTQLYALWQEPEVQAFLEKPLRQIAGNSDSALNALLQERVIGLLQGEIFLAVTHISPPPIIQAGIIIGADVKRKRLETQAYLQLVEHDLARRFPDATATDKSYLGHTYTDWQLSRDKHVCHAFLNSLLIVTLDENLMRDVITRFTHQSSPDFKPLAASERFKAALKQFPAGHEGVAYLNVQQILNLFAPLMALSPQSAGMFQQFAAIGASATSVTFNDAHIEDVSLVSYSGQHKPAPGIERRTLALTSPDTSLYTVRAMELAGSYRNAMNSLAQSGNATMTAAATQFERGLRAQGLRADELLAKIGPEVALLGIWREGMRWPDVAVVAELSDAADSRPKLDAAFESGVGPSEAQSHLGEVLHVWHVASAFSPSYVATDKFLIVASSADYARALLAQSKSGGPTLAGNADFANAIKHVPAKASSLSYCDVRTVFGVLYRLANANVQTNQFVDLGRLPRAETLMKHLAPYISATDDTAEMQTTTTFSSLGKPLTFVVGAAGIIAAAPPFLGDLIPSLIPGLPIPSSGNPPAGNQMAPSRIPSSP